jgi:broad specificity phosphatase PhoE
VTAADGIEPHPSIPLAPVSPLVVVLIRHAERVAGGTDPALSAAGRARAKLLAQMFADSAVQGVYVTEFLRSRQTGKPTAATAGVPLTEYAATGGAALAAAIIAGHSSGTVLVVAHSNTVDDIAAALGATGVGELAENEFDRMFILARRSCGTSLLRLRYGAKAH